ncbi:MAG: hypothetical protein K0R99_5038 [Microbacterium sp.]|uniref:hypothetical protein n=1 Tax=Microbacterium sp. TaxID=51671 RepID=UPI00261D198B|nr:hypothetical protein [Microbacterium sp.]MDF2563592.1 hypothetical protein [Microbacterium sp.]
MTESTGSTGRVLWTMRILSAIALLAAGGIHLFLVFNGVGGFLGVMFVLNAIAALVLAIGMLASTWDFTLVPETVIVESIGIVILAITTVLVLRRTPVTAGTRRQAA